METLVKPEADFKTRQVTAMHGDVGTPETPSPVTGEFPFLNFEWLMSEFTAMPIQMFNWVSRPDQAFQANAAAAGAILLGMTLAMNAVAIWIRYRFRKKISW